MLSLLCQVYESNNCILPVRRVELYGRCLRGLLRDWKEEHEKRAIDESSVEAVLELLSYVSYTLVMQRREQFSEGVLRHIISAWLQQALPYHELRQHDPTTLIRMLKQEGVLISTGTRGDLLVLHRTFQEYLAACGLVQQPDWLEEALQHLYDPSWREVLRLLGGVLTESDKPLMPYIVALLQHNAEDLLCRPFQHALLALQEAEI